MIFVKNTIRTTGNNQYIERVFEVMFGRFDDHRDFLLSYFDHCKWLDNTGIWPDKLMESARKIVDSDSSRVLTRARLIELVLTKARIAIDARSCFAEAIDHNDLLLKIRTEWMDEIDKNQMQELLSEHKPAMKACAYDGNVDFGHISPDWAALIKRGFVGIRDVIVERREENADNAEFYDACIIVLDAVMSYMKRLEDAARTAGMDDCAGRLAALQAREPRSVPEVYQLIDIVYMLLTHVEGENLRSCGRFDRLIGPIFESDISSGRYTKEELAEYTKHFFAKLHAYRFSANVPFVLGGVNPDGTDVINEYAYFLIDVYRSMQIHDPKLQIRIGKSTPSGFIEKILDCIRNGMNSFVFVNDDIAIPAMMNLGATLDEARDYLLIGCYEPAISGREVPCTCNGTINLAQVIIAALNDGYDPKNGIQIGLHTGTPETLKNFDALLKAVKTQYTYFAESAMHIINEYEKLYPLLNPAPILSSLLPDCIEAGRDVYSGGAKYNNSSINNIGLATAVDSLCAIRKLVYEDEAVSLKDLMECVNSDWNGYERLRLTCIHKAPKFGNNDDKADELAKWFVDLADETLNGRPNGRGGKYRSGFFSINWNISYGKRTGATPDGRHACEPFSKNLCASIGRDKAGITALIQSQAKLDHKKMPNGAVLDVILHPSAVKGEEGLRAFAELLATYMRLGCYGIHFNIMDAQRLRAAQKDPEKYASMQVRVCGWNAYFVNLDEIEQNQFILQAEGM